MDNFDQSARAGTIMDVLSAMVTSASVRPQVVERLDKIAEEFIDPIPKGDTSTKAAVSGALASAYIDEAVALTVIALMMAGRDRAEVRDTLFKKVQKSLEEAMDQAGMPK